MNVYDAVSVFYKRYRGEKLIYGMSEEGRNLYAFFVGQHGKEGISQYALHAREWITSMLALEHIRRGMDTGGMWVLPLTNPDGALLCNEGIESVSPAYREQLLQVNGGEDFSLWKANARCVDLNVNFPARWGTGKENVKTPAPANYIGEKPLCAKESRALLEFTSLISPRYTLSYHTKGEEIYWRFHQPAARARRDKKLAEALSKSTGYPLKDAPNSAGGYKDWCVETLQIPAFTIEAGRDDFSHPLGFYALPDLFEKNLDAPNALAREMNFSTGV